jgi:mono/diheme cytochrome c family protein
MKLPLPHLGGERSKMILRRLSVTVMVLILGSILPACDYGRMNDQEAIQTYRAQLPPLPERTVPTTGGIQLIRETSPDKLRNPLPRNQETLERGKSGYGYYCVMCHGSRFDGNGTVGQSFYPLPTHLNNPGVQSQNDGRLFYTITFGFNRHPALGFMISEPDRWAIIHFIRSLSSEPRG